MKRNYHILSAIILLLLLGWLISLTSCSSINSLESKSTATNSVSATPAAPLYYVATPTTQQLAGTYYTQNKKYHNSTIQIFPDGEFVWNSWTSMVETFRGTVSDINSNGFSVKLSDNSAIFHFQFTPDKRGFSSLDQNGNTIEEYDK